MARESSRKAFWIALLAILIVSPALLLSNWGLGKVQQYIDRNTGEPWAADWQYRLAEIYAWTVRPQQAVWCYEAAADLYVRRGDRDSAARALYKRAVEMENLPDGRSQALAAYEAIEREFPGHPVAEQARGAAIRIRMMSRP